VKSAGQGGERQGKKESAMVGSEECASLPKISHNLNAFALNRSHVLAVRGDSEGWREGHQSWTGLALISESGRDIGPIRAVILKRDGK